MYAGHAIMMAPAGAAAGAGNAETLKPIAFAAGASDGGFGLDIDSFGIFISIKKLLPPPVHGQPSMFRCSTPIMVMLK